MKSGFGQQTHHGDGSADDGELASKFIARPRNEGSSDNAGEVLRCASNAEQAARGRAEVGVPCRHRLKTVEKGAVCAFDRICLISLEYPQAINEAFCPGDGK